MDRVSVRSLEAWEILVRREVSDKYGIGVATKAPRA